MHKIKERPYPHFHKLPKRKLSEGERHAIVFQLEKARIKRDKSIMIMNRGLVIYFCVIFVAVLGFVNDYFSKLTLNLLAIAAMLLLLLAALPFILSMYRDEKELDDLIKGLISKK